MQYQKYVLTSKGNIKCKGLVEDGDHSPKRGEKATYLLPSSWVGNLEATVRRLKLLDVVERDCIKRFTR
jgi:hypothetical protein